MKVAINCRSFLLPEHTGIGRYAGHLVHNLAKIDTENQYLLYARKNIFDRRRKIPRPSGDNFDVRVDRFGQGIDAVAGDADIYHAPSPDYLKTKHRKIVVTVHDMIHLTYPQSHTSSTVDLMNDYFKDIADRATKIICCSKNTQYDLNETFDIDPDRSCVVYNGVNHDIFYVIDEEERELAQQYVGQLGVDRPFMLFVGTIEPRKNLTTLLKSFHQLKSQGKFDGQLVIVGMKGWMSDDIIPLIRSLDLENDIVFVGFIADKELRWFYNLCSVFAFPSFYEGFGFPILEAFCCGAPVVTSNTSSCVEVAADAAYIIDPKSHEDLSEKLVCALRNNDDNAVLKEKALKRAQEFSLIKSAQETLNVYQQVHLM